MGLEELVLSGQPATLTHQRLGRYWLMINGVFGRELGLSGRGLERQTLGSGGKTAGRHYSHTENIFCLVVLTWVTNSESTLQLLNFCFLFPVN